MPTKEMPTKRRAPSEATELNRLRSSSNGSGSHRVVEIQRARILTAMVDVCFEHGVGDVTVGHVVERAGVSRRTFYEIFVDREDCFLAAFDEGVACASRCVLDVYDPGARWVDRIRTALIALLEFLDDEHAMGWLLVVGSLGAGAAALERRKRIITQIAAAIDEGRKQAKNGDGLPSLTAEGVVGGVISVLHSRLLEKSSGRLVELSGQLMGMIVLPYLGTSAARRELVRPIPKLASRDDATDSVSNPLMRLQMRLTYRTVRVLMEIAAHPGSSNRIVAKAAGVTDQGQMSKLLARLAQLDLIANAGAGSARGEPNAWTLTNEGWQIHQAITQTTHQ